MFFWICFNSTTLRTYYQSSISLHWEMNMNFYPLVEMLYHLQKLTLSIRSQWPSRRHLTSMLSVHTNWPPQFSDWFSSSCRCTRSMLICCSAHSGCRLCSLWDRTMLEAKSTTPLRQSSFVRNKFISFSAVKALSPKQRPLAHTHMHTHTHMKKISDERQSRSKIGCSPMIEHGCSERRCSKNRQCIARRISNQYSISLIMKPIRKLTAPHGRA